MISVIITSYKEPHLIGNAIQAVLRNKTKEKYNIIAAAPDEPTAKVIKEFAKKNKKILYFKDKGRGKANALNEIFQKVKSDILILTDGDVTISENAIESIAATFKNKQIGCVSGRPIASNDKKTMLGYFSHLLVDAGAHKIREELSKKDQFLECSGYLFAFRNKIRSIPTNVAEDSIIPYILWKQGYKIKYVPEAKVYVKYPNNLKEFMKQRVRTAKSHEKLTNYAPDFPRVKTFKNELLKGPIKALSYASNVKEIVWTLLLFPIRLYIWLKVLSEVRVKKQEYTDRWERIESTK